MPLWKHLVLKSPAQNIIAGHSVHVLIKPQNY